jgi:hypothetical protein
MILNALGLKKIKKHFLLNKSYLLNTNLSNMKHLLKSLFICSLLCIGHLTQAQTLNNFSLKDIGQSIVIVTDGNGKEVNLGVDMENYGSPFFDPEFLPANIVLATGQRYENVLIKINLLSSEVIYKTPEGKELAVLPAIKQVELNKNGNLLFFEYGFPVFEKQNHKTIYQVLAKGKVSLIKYFFIQVTEAKPYGSATMLRTIEQFPRLFLYDQSMRLKKAPKSNEDLLSLYKEDEARLKGILEKNNLKIKKESDFIKCIATLNEN